MTTKITVNGLIGPETATIPVLDRGFLYGDSVYEVLRTYHGLPFAEAEHLDRLERSAELLGIAMPVPRSTLIEELRATLAAAGNPESYLRLVITRGAGPIGLDPELAIEPCRVIIVTELHEYPAELYRRGAGICLIAAGRSGSGALPAGAKSGNYLVNIMALAAAKRKGAHEALMLDADGHLTEGSSSNIFVVRGSCIHTPPLSAGILEGITRRKVIGLARQAGFSVEELPLRSTDLDEADEVFLTSTIREVLPVTSVDGRPVGRGEPGPIAVRLRELFRSLTA